VSGTVREQELVQAADDSALAMSLLRIDRGASHTSTTATDDTLLFVAEGSGSLVLGGDPVALEAGSGVLVLAGEEAAIDASSMLALLRVTVGPNADRHAPLGPREAVVHLALPGSEAATGARSFQILFGPHNGSTRATLFAGFIPPGKAPWHYHLYDEIVWVPEGPGRLHLDEDTQELGPGSSFRLRPRQVHIVENLSPDREITIIGVFTPAGSPSAAYLTPDVAAAYRVGG
jgi:quercetin dioxygenase-like cupin family protein